MAFKVLIEKPAVSDLHGILKYINETLKEPEAAKRIYKTIKEQILTLKAFPFRQPLIFGEIFASKGLRKLLVGNYNIFYTVDEENQNVHVLRILYNRREWQALIQASR